jgi:uncharacterized protein YegJ (DUF2314 family)
MPVLWTFYYLGLPLFKLPAFFVFFLRNCAVCAGLLLCAACGGKARASVPALNIDRTLGVDVSDAELLSIALRARESLPRFIWRMQNPGGGERDFRVKCPFPADGVSGFYREYLWLGDISFRDGAYYGRVLNRPLYVSGLREGALSSFSVDDICDWMFFKDGKIKGGLSVKYLIEEIPPHERDEELERLLELFDSPNPYSFD